MQNGDRIKAVGLEKLLQRGVHIERASEFKNSIFEDVFQNAVYSVERIVEDNRLRREGLYQKERFAEIEILNVISFIGQRGTGKTSAILSFQKALEEYDGGRKGCKERNIRFDRKANMEDVRFFTLNQIDASVLEESEDVFILVLAGMYRYLKDRREAMYKEVEYRALLDGLGEIYEDFLNLKKEKQYEKELYSNMECLEHVASSQNIRIQFEELVEKYLEYILKSKGNSCSECYLVVTVDDVDMAHYNEKRTGDLSQRQNMKSYEIINSIHKYLTIPGIIVLTAYNHVNLMRQNWNFFEEYDWSKSRKQRVYKDESDSAALASQFMDKVFSLDYRIYMPSWRKNDFGGQRFLIDVKTKSEVRDNIFFQYSHLKNGEQYLSVEEFIFVLYAAKTGIYFDFNQERMHYLNPESLRSLVSVVKLFDFPGYELEQVAAKRDHQGQVVDQDRDRDRDRDQDLELEQYRKNVFMRIKYDAYYRYVQESLFSSKERAFFDELTTLRIDRRSRKIVERFCERYTRLGKAKKKMERENGKDEELESNFSNRNVDYSFAELIHMLYHIKREEGSGLTQLAACILYSYSISLSEVYDSYREELCRVRTGDLTKIYRYKKDAVRIRKFKNLDNCYEILKGVIGKSICGHWAEYYFPEVYPVFLGRKLQSALIFGCADTGEVGYSVSVRSAEPGKGNVTEGAVIEQFLAYALLYADVLDWKGVQFGIRLGDGEQYSIEFIVPGRHELEMTAYMNYAFQYRDFLWKLEKLLSEEIQRRQEKLQNMIEDETIRKKDDLLREKEILESLQEAVDKKFARLWDSFVKWDKKFGAMMFPIHNFDCAYSLMERMYLETVDRNDAREIKNYDDFWTAFDGMNEMFGRYLREIDKFYGREKADWNFYEIFEQCPFFELFKTVKANEAMSRNMGEYIVNIISMIAGNERIEEAPDEMTKVGR